MSGWLKERASTRCFGCVHPLYRQAEQLSAQVIAAAIEVHRDKGPGLVEPIYEWCLMRELDLRGLKAVSQCVVQITYKGFVRSDPLRFDILVEDSILIEAKAVDRVVPLHRAQLLSYMKLLKVPVGLLINFNVDRLVDGVSRLYLPGANR